MLIPPAGFLFIEFLGWNASRAHSWQDKESVISWEEGVEQGLLANRAARKTHDKLLQACKRSG